MALISFHSDYEVLSAVLLTVPFLWSVGSRLLLLPFSWWFSARSLAWLSPVSSTGCLFSCRPRSSRKTALLPPCWPQVLYSTAATQCRLQQWQEARDTLEKAVVWRPEGRSATLALALERVQVRLPLWVPGEVLWAQAEESKIRICRMFYVFGFSWLPTSLVTWWHSKQFLCDALPSFS